MLSRTTQASQDTSAFADGIGPDGLDHRQRTAQVTIADLYERGYRQYGSRVAVRDGDTTLTYRELGDRAHRIVGGLTELGVRRGDRGVLLLGNRAEFFEIEHALFVGGFVRTALGIRLHLREVVHIVNDCTAAVVFAAPDWAERLAGVRDQLPALRHVVTVSGGPGDTQRRSRTSCRPCPRCRRSRSSVSRTQCGARRSRPSSWSATGTR